MVTGFRDASSRHECDWFALFYRPSLSAPDVLYAVQSASTCVQTAVGVCCSAKCRGWIAIRRGGTSDEVLLEIMRRARIDDRSVRSGCGLDYFSEGGGRYSDSERSGGCGSRRRIPQRRVDISSVSRA